MTIDSTSSQAQNINTLMAQQTREVPGERENDGDSDDMTRSVANRSASPAMNPQGVGTKVDLFA